MSYTTSFNVRHLFKVIHYTSLHILNESSALITQKFWNRSFTTVSRGRLNYIRNRQTILSRNFCCLSAKKSSASLNKHYHRSYSFIPKWLFKMAPVLQPSQLVKQYIDSNRVMVFSKSTCPYCSSVKRYFEKAHIPIHSLELDYADNGTKIQQALYDLTGQRTVPNIFINGIHVGGADKLFALDRLGKVRELLEGGRLATSTSPTHVDGNTTASGSSVDDAKEYDYDLVVIGGGSGGLATSKEAAKFGKRVAVFDYIVPTPIGTTWGLGGTCVNVGCIPKKLMHQAALLNESTADSVSYGWEYPDQKNSEPIASSFRPQSPAPERESDRAPENRSKDEYAGSLNQQDPTPGSTGMEESFHKEEQTVRFKNPDRVHSWNKMVGAIQDYLHSLNFKYRTQLRDKSIKYFNAYARFLDPHTVEAEEKNGKVVKVSSKYFVIATGLRPHYLDIPGAREYCITSDDIFSLEYPPGKTLCVGASYISLETAGFLHGLGFQVTVMVRSIILRGFDQQMAEFAGKYMASHGVTFIRPAVPTKIEKLEDGKPGRYLVHYKMDDGSTHSEEYNTVLLAIGRVAKTDHLRLEKIGVKVNPKNNKLITTNERSSLPHVFGVGDNIDGRPELTPVAVEAGTLLARRLFGGSDLQCDYDSVPTTVFTPLEYGACGLTEEEARLKYGNEDIEVYHTGFKPLEWVIPAREDNACYGKIIVVKSEKERVVGIHYIGPHAGEVIQGYAVGIKVGATKADFDRTIGIHPTNSEIFTTLSVSKSSGQAVEQAGC